MLTCRYIAQLSLDRPEWSIFRHYIWNYTVAALEDAHKGLMYAVNVQVRREQARKTELGRSDNHSKTFWRDEERRWQSILGLSSLVKRTSTDRTCWVYRNNLRLLLVQARELVEPIGDEATNDVVMKIRKRDLDHVLEGVKQNKDNFEEHSDHLV